MIISSWNVNSVRARIENIKEYIKKFSPDVLMMQEIKTPDDTYPYDDINSLTKSIQRLEYSILPEAIKHVKQRSPTQVC